MDSYFLKITGSVNIPQALEIEKEYGFGGAISLYGSDVRSLHDGDNTVTYKAQFTDIVKLVEGDSVLNLRTKTKKSYQLRKACIFEGIDYDEFVTWMLEPERFKKFVRFFQQR